MDFLVSFVEIFTILRNIGYQGFTLPGRYRKYLPVGTGTYLVHVLRLNLKIEHHCFHESMT